MSKTYDICGFKQPPPHRSSLDSLLTTAICGYVTFTFEIVVARFLFLVRNMFTCHMRLWKIKFEFVSNLQYLISDYKFTFY